MKKTRDSDKKYNINYDNYLHTNACTESTGLQATPAKTREEWELYREVLDFAPTAGKHQK